MISKVWCSSIFLKRAILSLELIRFSEASARKHAKSALQRFSFTPRIMLLHTPRWLLWLQFMIVGSKLFLTYFIQTIVPSLTFPMSKDDKSLDWPTFCQWYQGYAVCRRVISEEGVFSSRIKALKWSQCVSLEQRFSNCVPRNTGVP